MPHARYDRIDALRGTAIVWMTVFHFCFDLNYFGFVRQNFNADPFWTLQRSAIVTLFLLCAGLGQAVAVQQGQSWTRFGRRWLQVAGCAVLVTAGSLLMFPQSYIYFGVLHGIAVMLVVTRLTAGWGGWLWLAGALAIAMQFALSALLAPGQMLSGWAGALNARSLNWLGVITQKPITEDYVPLLPWLGVMWLGLAAGQWLLKRHRHVVEGSLPAALAPLAWLGRWSLSWYMLHQPVMIGLVGGVYWLSHRS